MAERYFVLLDATLESQAPRFASNPIFQSWLHSYDNVPEALEFISQIKRPYSIQVYIARDNLLDNGLPSHTNGQTRTLIETFNDLNTIDHVDILCPTVTIEFEQEARKTFTDPRLVKKVVSIINTPVHICEEGISYFRDEEARCPGRNETHLIPNLKRNIDELMIYLDEVIRARRRIIDTLVEEHSNKSGEEAT